MLHIKTNSGNRYIVMGSRVLKNNLRLKYKNCPIVLSVGCCDGQGGRQYDKPMIGKNLSIRFRSTGYYIDDEIVEITEE